MQQKLKEVKGDTGPMTGRKEWSKAVLNCSRTEQNRRMEQTHLNGTFFEPSLE